MIRSLVGTLCALSIFCGLAYSIAPEGSSKRAMKLVCSIVLLACVLGFVKSPDWEEYALEASLLRAREKEFLEQSEERSRELDRLVIEGACNSYIRDEAERLEITLEGVSVRARWSMDGIWVPYEVSLTGETDPEQRDALCGLIHANLGIPPERQEWVRNGT